MMGARLLWGMAFAMLAGCLGTAAAQDDPPIVPDIATADFGQYPSDYVSLIKSWAETNLKDPYSAKYVRISIPRREWAVANKQPIYGWSVCAMINAKNSYGAYAGVETYWFFIRDGQIVRSQDTDKPGGIPSLGLVIPGTSISVGHDVNCADGKAPPPAAQ